VYRSLHTGLVVKILAKSLKEAGHYKKKGVVRRIPAPRKAVVEILGAAAAGAAGGGDGGGKEGEGAAVLVEVDERDLETVLPAPGKPVRVVKGDHAGATGELKAVHEKRFLAEVAVDAADGVRQRVEFLQYDEVCKVHHGCITTFSIYS
jgi:DNA/RNA-binding protein KIN17